MLDLLKNNEAAREKANASRLFRTRVEAIFKYSRSTLIQTQKHGVAGAVGRVFVFLLS